MRTTLTKLAAVTVLVAASSGCGDLVREGRSPVQVVINSLVAAQGNTPDQFGGTLRSDVLTIVTEPAPCSEASPCATIFNDVGQVTMSLLLKDQGSATVPASPTPINQVTFTRYRVVYRRTDGRNTPGVDVPQPIDTGLTFTVATTGTTAAGFEIVRHTAKQEAPLAALTTNATIISTVADVSFYGRDQAGNEITATGSIGVLFGNFGDSQ